MLSTFSTTRYVVVYNTAIFYVGILPISNCRRGRAVSSVAVL